MAVLVSVLIPVYNAGGYLVETVQSVLAQSVQNFEVILVDDGSTDGCLRSAEDLTDPRIQILRQANQGAPAAMNRALSAATGEFVAFLDHDDLWTVGKLEAQLDHFAAHPEADITFSWSRWIDEHGKDLNLAPRRWQGPISFEELVRDFVIGNTSSMVARRAVVQEVGGFDLSLPRAYDQDLVLRIARLRPGNVQATPKVLTSYRRHPGQMSRRWQDAVPEWGRLRERIQNYGHPPVSSESLAVGDRNMQRYFAWLAYEEQEYGQACRLLAGVFRAGTWQALGDRRNWLLGGASVAGWLLPRPVHLAVEAGVKRLLAPVSLLLQ